MHFRSVQLLDQPVGGTLGARFLVDAVDAVLGKADHVASVVDGLDGTTLGCRPPGALDQAGDGVDRRIEIVVQAVERLANRLPHHPARGEIRRSEEHTSELQSLMRISYAVFCLKKKNKTRTQDKKQ